MQFRSYEKRVAKTRVIGFCTLAGLALIAAPAIASEPQRDDEEEEIIIYDQHADTRVACETGNGDACYALGGLYETRKDLWGAPVEGDGVKRDDMKAARYFRLSCDNGRKEGCQRAGRMYAAGKGVKKNRAEAAKLFAKACELGATRHCRGASPSAAE